MTSGKLRAVVVGCGGIGSRYDELSNSPTSALTHAGAYSAHPAFVLTGLIDADPARVSQAAQFWNVPRDAASDVALLDRKKFDVASIATPAQSRLSLFEALINNGVRAIVCEKPLASSVNEGERIIELCENAGVVLAVNYLRRWEPACRRIHEELSQGSLGLVRRITGTYVRGISNNGGHLIDLITFWHAPIVKVEAVTIREHDSIDAAFLCADKVPVSLIELSGTDYDVFELTVYCERGVVTLEDFGRSISLRHQCDDPEYRGFVSLAEKRHIQSDLSNTLRATLDDIVDCINHQKSPACCGEDGLKVLKVIELVKAAQTANS